MFCLNVNNSNLMWLTRGKNWEFRFLSEPQVLISGKNLYKSVFLQDEGRVGYWKGCYFENDKILFYTACRCFDEEIICRDAANRRIPHDFLIICSWEEQKQLAHLQWGQFVIEKTRDLYYQQYDLDYSKVKKCIVNFDLTDDVLSRLELCSDVLEVKNEDVSRPKRNQKNTFLFMIMFLLLVCVLGVTCFFLWGKKVKHNNSVEDATINIRNNLESLDYKPCEKESPEPDKVLSVKGEDQVAEE